MIIDSLIKSKATELRKIGKSYNEIHTELGISKSTLSGWLSKIPLSEEATSILKQKSIVGTLLNQKKGAYANKIKRQKQLEVVKANAFQLYNVYKDDPMFIMGLALYWSEGSKRAKSIQFTNSDPDMVKFALYWFIKYLNTNKDKFKCYLNIHSGQKETEIIKFWRCCLNLNEKQFGKSYIKPESTGFKKNILYNGTIRLGYHNSDLFHTILDWIEMIKERNIAILGR